MSVESVIEKVGSFVREFLGASSHPTSKNQHQKGAQSMNPRRFRRVVKKTVIQVLHYPNRRRRR